MLNLPHPAAHASLPKPEEEQADMFKFNRQVASASTKLTKHAQEMEALRLQHERILKDPSLREATLVKSGVFSRSRDGRLVVAKPYSKVITSKRAA